ncbi:porin family protein [Thiotrichales bacterium 19S11-10]|nr:porin family protein [Thiotrichales bacterium 19S11-10]MCF6807940.1 porin family protein [Thiotrichales bacterium 19S9-11]MCF6811955.1 porin family protein [Thiotrichales bacterium 19S9-12]
MLKKKRYTASIIAASLASSMAFADQEVTVPTEASMHSQSTKSSSSLEQTKQKSPPRYDSMAKPKRYVNPPNFSFTVGGQLGYGMATTDDVSGYNTDEGGIIGGIFVGSDYRWNKLVQTGLELGYYYGANLLEYKSTTGSSNIKVKRTTIIPLLAKLTFDLPAHFNVYIKGGIAYVNQRVEDATHINYNGVLGAGVGYKWDNLGIFSEYMHTFGSDGALSDKNRTFPIDTIMLGVSYSLPF